VNCDERFHRPSRRLLDRYIDPSAKRRERGLDLIEPQGMVEPKQTIDRFPIPAQTTCQLGARDLGISSA
jgi:hypothetical protein